MLSDSDASSQYNVPSVEITSAESTVGDLTELNSEMFADIDVISPTPSARSSLSPHPSAQVKLKRKRTSWIWKHQAGTDDMQALFFNDDNKEVWPCKHYALKGLKKEFVVTGGTLKIENHLTKEHHIFHDTAQETRAKNQQMSIQESIDTAALNTAKRRKLAEEDAIEKKLDGAVLESLFVRWIATDNQALELVECPAFRAFLTYINSNINVYLPSSRSTVTDWVLRQFNIEKERVKARVQSTRTRIHLSCDIWTSPSSLPILGVIPHYISEDNTLEHTVLGMKEIIGLHDGENVSKVIYRILADWGIVSKLGWMRMDNATNNDTMIRYISQSKRGF
jgi:hypothetical protein